MTDSAVIALHTNKSVVEAATGRTAFLPVRDPALGEYYDRPSLDQLAEAFLQAETYVNDCRAIMEKARKEYDIADKARSAARNNFMTAFDDIMTLKVLGR